MSDMPWGSMFGLLFMTMGPIRAIAVFSRVGDADDAPGVQDLARRAALLMAAAFAMTILLGTGVLQAWGVSFPALIGAGGLVLVALSFQSLLNPAPPASPVDPGQVQAASVAFPGLFPPVAVAVPLIFAVPFPGWSTKIGILGLGLGIVLVNWLAMRRSKAILRMVGPVPLQLFGAVFGLLQLALGLQFIIGAWERL